MVAQQYHTYYSKLRTLITSTTLHEFCSNISISIKCRSIKLALICFFIVAIYINFSACITKPISATVDTAIVSLPNQSKSNVLQHPKAYIITENCKSLRFNVTKENIERAFPNFFTITCYLFVSLNDSRIHPASLSVLKRFSSNLLTFVDIWSQEIQNEPNTKDFDWTFIFEDDVNFINASKVSLTNYISALRELMFNPEIQLKHGFFYLGICGPTLENMTQVLLSDNTNKSLVSYRNCGFCLHATGITKVRSRTFWGEIASYRPNGDTALDKQIQEYCIRSRSFFYTLGSNLHFPPNTGHYGIAYQDRGRFYSTVV